MTGSALRRAVRMIGGVGLMVVIAAIQSGCVETVLGGAATVGVAATEDRGMGGAAADLRIHADINEKWLQASMDMLQKVDLTVQEGRVHLTGTVPTPEMRLNAVKLVWQVEGVRQVIDDIEVGEDKGTAGSYARDVWISTQLRTKILFDGDVRSQNYSVETVEGTVYLMGVAQSQKELDRVTDHARNLSYVKRVVSYVRIKDQPLPTRPAQATGAPSGASPAPLPAASPGASPGPSPAAVERAPVETEPLAEPPARNPS